MGGIYTKTGDKGQTSLLSGERVYKDDLRVEIYGTFDEMSAIVGLARVHAACQPEFLQWLQERNFALSAELAGGDPKKLKEPIAAGDIERLEAQADRVQGFLSGRFRFTVPARNPASGFLHQARAVARRGERHLASLMREREIREEIRQYVNRLSDVLYMLAREEELVQEIYDKVVSVAGKAESPLTQGGADRMSERQKRLYEAAEELIRAGMVKAKEIGVPMVLAVVDGGGNLVAYRRMPDSLLVSVTVAQGKAYTAAAFRQATDKLDADVQPGASLYGIAHTDPGRIITYGGGYPLFIESEFVGGLGVSGGTVEEDMACAGYAISVVAGVESKA